MYNFDESGFSIGTSILTRVLTNTMEKGSRKFVPGRQEWITAIESISATGRALLLLVNFTGEHTSTG